MIAPDDRLDCDMLVVGSGAGALCAALTASHAGLKVLVLEKERWFGGASARAGGGLWLPGNQLAERAGIEDSREAALTYIRHETGPRFDAARVTAFLDHGPDMLDFVLRETPVRFVVMRGGSNDYHPNSPGGLTIGRAIMPLSVSTKVLGRDIDRLRRPLRTGTVLGMPIGIEDLLPFSTAGRRLSSAAYVAKRLIGHAWDMLIHGRSTRLALGNALVGSLAGRCIERGVRLLTSAPVRSLRIAGDRVTGAIAEIDGRLVEVRARKGVLLATGGFPHDGARRARLFPTGATNPEVWGLMPYGNSGDGLRMAEAVGAAVEEDMASPVALAPVSRIEGDEGELACFPVFASRANPGKIAVKRNGRRFTDEAASYHDFGVGLLKASEGEEEAVAFIISDHRALRRYGMGHAAPFPMPIGRHLKSGYLIRGATLRELAAKAGIDADALERTVAEFNAYATEGIDPEFGRGTTDYDRMAGDPEQKPCPCLGPLTAPPYYAVRVFAGAVGTFAGLKSNAHAQVLRGDGTPIAGLYAAGNDLESITGGDYIGGGCTIGPAMTFGYIAANHMAAS